MCACRWGAEDDDVARGILWVAVLDIALWTAIIIGVLWGCHDRGFGYTAVTDLRVMA